MEKINVNLGFNILNYIFNYSIRFFSIIKISIFIFKFLNIVQNRFDEIMGDMSIFLIGSLLVKKENGYVILNKCGG